jgi:hypothetical protein
MKKLLLIVLFSWLADSLRAQYVYTINADSVKITNHCDTAELILENHTQNVSGFLFNKGRGRTEFRRVLQKINPSVYLIGGDTLFASPYAWLQDGNTFGTTGILGTLDNNHLDLYTNNTRQLRLTNTGNLLMGSTTDMGARLQVNGSGGIYTNPGSDSGNGIGHLFLNGGGTSDIIGTYGHDMIFKLPSVAETFRFQFGNSAHLFESANDFNIIGNNGGNITLACSNKYIDIRGAQNIFTDASYINLTANNYNGGDGVIIQRGTRSTLKTDPVLSVRDSITDVFKVLRNGSHLVTGNITGLSPAQAIYTPTVSSVTGAGDFTTVTGMRIAPTLNFGNNNQQAYAVDITPTYNLNGYAQYTDGISSALHIASSLGGIRIEQNSTYSGNSGQPIYLYQGAGTDKEEIVNYRNNTPTLRPFIWDVDNRPLSTGGSIIPVIRNSLTPNNTIAGGGISITMDRYYWATDASIDMKYERSPNSNVDSTLKTAIAFNTNDLGYRSAALYISGSKIGMGTSTPTAQLHTTSGVRFAGLTPDTAQTRVIVSDVNGNLYYRNLASWAVNNHFDNGLSVAGTLDAQKINIHPGRWADYVFDKTYRLPSLADVEHYIQQNNHLPGIPSAVEVQQNGLEVGENQAALLKKIEELTLYIIDLGKKVQKQAEENNALKEQNKRISSLEQRIDEIMKRISK